MLKSTSKKSSVNPWGEDHPEKPKRTDNSLKLTDQIKGLVNPENFFDQLLGLNKSPSRTELKEKSVNIKSNENVIFSRNLSSKNESLVHETQLIMVKLKEQISLLEQSEKNLSSDIAKLKVEQLPPKTSLYFLSYLEWMISVVKQMRIKVEDGRAWLATFSRRQKKKAGYWGMYKKHGTTFGLSHERTLATQTG